MLDRRSRYVAGHCYTTLFSQMIPHHAYHLSLSHYGPLFNVDKPTQHIRRKKGNQIGLMRVDDIVDKERLVGSQMQQERRS